jgi:amino acid transporter
LWLGRLTAFGALCNLQIGYLSFFWPAAASGWTRGLVITGVVIVLTIVNLVGVRESALVTNIFTIGKLAPLLLFVGVGVFFISPRAFAVTDATSFSDFSRASLLLIFAFSGFEAAMIPAGEVRDPRRHVAFALLTGTGAVALLYLLIQVVCIGTLPGLAGAERPLVEACSRFLGAAGASMLSLGALISVTGTLNTGMLAGPRILFAMAEQGQLPRSLTATHRRFHTPHIAILISAAIMLALTLQGSFMSAVTITTVIRLLTYIATCVSLPVLRLRKGAPPARFTAPAGVAVAVAATGLSVWLLSNSPLTDLRAAALAAAAGLLIFFVTGKSHIAECDDVTP